MKVVHGPGPGGGPWTGGQCYVYTPFTFHTFHVLLGCYFLKLAQAIKSE